MVTKKNKKMFLLLFCIFFLLVVLYFSLNKIITLEGLENQINPINATSDSEYCGSTNPYDSDGVEITNHSVMKSDSEVVSLEKGVPFELYSDNTLLDFSDVVGSNTSYNFDITTSDYNASDIGLSTGTTTTGSNGKGARQYTTTIKDDSDSERCNYTYYVEDNL